MAERGSGYMCVGGTSCHVAYCGYFGDGMNVDGELFEEEEGGDDFEGGVEEEEVG